MRIKRLLVTVAAVATVQAAYADVYRYTAEDGAECFTDSPTPGATLHIREQKRPKQQNTATRTTSSRSSGTGGTSSRLPVEGIITSHAGLRIDPIDGEVRMHKGVDIAVPHGTPVKPIAPGIITFSGVRQGYGNTVMIQHDDGLTTLYAHNAENFVTPGTQVDEKTTLALSGATGRCTGPHLHFEAWRNGENVTSEYVSGSNTTTTGTRYAKTSSWIKRYVQDDGTLVFTNLH